LALHQTTACHSDFEADTPDEEGEIVLFGICGWPCEESGGGTKVYGQCFKQISGFHVRRPKALVPSQFSLHRGDNVWEKLSVEQKNGGQLEVQMPKSLHYIQLVRTPILLAWVHILPDVHSVRICAFWCMSEFIAARENPRLLCTLPIVTCVLNAKLEA